MAILVLIRLALPTPPDRIRQSATTDTELTAFIRSASEPRPSAPVSTDAQVSLGKLLYEDNDFIPYLAGRSGRNESCAGCHNQGGASTTFLTSDRQAPDLQRTAFYTHFGFSGRTRSLDTFIASHIEARNELGSSRVRVARMMYTKYRKPYEEAFQALPAIDLTSLPEDGTPSLDLHEFPVPVSSFILETLRDREQLASLLSQAQSEHLAPAVIVSRAIFLPRLPDVAATEQFYKLPADVQAMVNAVFQNAVRSLSQYILSRNLPEPPFDRFAAKVTGGKSLEDALSPEFGPDELTGLRLFHGAAGCARCHNGAAFTDNSFHNIGLPHANRPDPGHATGLVLADYREACVLVVALPPSPFPGAPVCPTEEERTQQMIAAVGAFRTPALRGMSPARRLTHNGQITTIDDMLTFYSQLDDRPAIGKRSALLSPLHLTREERAALSAFLATIARAD